MRNRLTPLQTDVLREFFARTQDFFLTGGAALAGFYVGHRDTLDLDLFTTTTALAEGDHVLHEVAHALGAHVEKLQTSRGFLRRLLRRGDESVVVDLVHDEAPQGAFGKTVRDGIPMDRPEEILANKLCALVSRAEIRDIVDVRALLARGLSLTEALGLAQQKDAGVTPAQIGWLLGEIRISEATRIPGDVAADELREFVSDLRRELARIAAPL